VILNNQQWGIRSVLIYLYTVQGSHRLLPRSQSQWVYPLANDPTWSKSSNETNIIGWMCGFMLKEREIRSLENPSHSEARIVFHVNSWTVRDVVTKFSGHHLMVEREAKFENGYMGVGICWFSHSFRHHAIIITWPPLAGHSE